MLYTSHEQQLDTPPETCQAMTVYNMTKRGLKERPSIALADRGANGCVEGNDCVWLGGSDIPRKVHILQVWMTTK